MSTHSSASPIRIDRLDCERIVACCSHARVPADPAGGGYRLFDLGGSLPPYHLARAGDGRLCGSIALVAPVSLADGGDAVSGEPAVALVQITLGAARTPIAGLLAAPARDPRWLPVCAALLQRLAALELYDPADCPLCGT
ncbi:MAG TPA: hypothetical protein VMU66_08065 [Gaiellales bacterium]|nr:hypothetical protein [Gaiellales bacterium]